MTGLLIRGLVADDLPAIAAYYGEGEGPLDQFADIERLRRLPREGWLVAVMEDKVVGFLYWFRHRRPFFDPGVEEYANVQELHMFEGFRRRGIARALMTRALEAIRSAGLRIIYIDTMDYNAPARALYEGLGFKELFRDVHYKLDLGGK